MYAPYTVTDLLSAMADGPVNAGTALARQAAPEATQKQLDDAYAQMQRAHVASSRRDWQAAERAIDTAYALLRADNPYPAPDWPSGLHPCQRSKRRFI